MTIPVDLPGADLVTAGIEALERGESTIEALLVAVGAPRLRDAGLDIPEPPPLEHPAEIALYLAIGVEHPEGTHSRYNALIRRLVSFERALESRNTARVRIDPGDAGSLPEGRVDYAVLDSTTEADLATPQREDEADAMRDMAQASSGSGRA